MQEEQELFSFAQPQIQPKNNNHPDLKMFGMVQPQAKDECLLIRDKDGNKDQSPKELKDDPINQG